ncbi:MAG: hypothetical protein RL514_4008 [Verrucomicrobiota bacterium]|jgi:DNA-binding NtrC family response regulator
MDLAGLLLPRKPDLRGQGQTLLFIEDDSVLRPLFVKSLERFNYRVLVAATVPEALLVWSAHRSEISAVVSDRHLGSDRDGLSLLQEFSADKPSIVMVLTSGSLTPEVIETLHRTTRIHCLSKPFALLDLLLILNRSLDNPAP